METTLHGPLVMETEEESEDWFLDIFVDKLEVIALWLIAFVAMIQGWVTSGFGVGLALFAVVLGLRVRGRLGLLAIGAGLGYLFGGGIGLPLGMVLAWFNSWVYELEMERSNKWVAKRLGMIDGFLVGCWIAVLGGGGLTQYVLCILLFGVIGRFVAELIPGIARFFEILDSPEG